MRFSIRDLLLVTVIVALAVGWGLHALRNAAIARENKRLRANLDAVLTVVRDTAQLTIKINDKGNTPAKMPRAGPQSIANKWQPFPPPSPLPPREIDYPVASRR